jgi:tetratricopeptide (TPR) repeat protein
MKRKRTGAPKASGGLSADLQRTLDLALEQHQKGQLDPAIEGYRVVLAAAPQQIDALMNLGAALTSAGRPGEAAIQLRRARAAAPDLARLHNDAGLCFAELGRWEEALDAFQAAATLAPAAGTPWKNLGRALVEVGREADAVTALQQAVLVEPLLAEAWFELARATFDAARPGPAIEALTRAVASDPAFVFARFLLGAALDLAGDARAAAHQFASLHEDKSVLAGAVDSWRYARERRTPATRFFLATRKTLLFALEQATLEGLSLELGVRYGMSARWIAEAAPGRILHGFDSFEGLPEAWHIQPKGVYSTHGERPEVPANVELHVGLFEETLPRFCASSAGPVRFLNVDCDLYSATKTALDVLGDRLVEGTIVVFDEYLVNDRWREDEHKAFQEAVAARKWQYEYLAFNLFTGQAVVRMGGVGPRAG